MPLVILHHLLNVFVQFANKRGFTQKKRFRKSGKQNESKALADNQVKIQHKTPEYYRTVIKDLAEKRTEFNIYTLKEISYKVVLKDMHYPTKIKTEIEKLWEHCYKYLEY
jgi:hypothetical protein